MIIYRDCPHCEKSVKLRYDEEPKKKIIIKCSHCKKGFRFKLSVKK